jgi:hypothetical protein
VDIPVLQVRDISNFYTDYIKHETSKNSTSNTSLANLHTEFSLSSEGKKKQLIDQLISQVVSQIITGALNGKK